MAIGKTPNFYQLNGNDIRVTYATDGIRGQPSFSYQDTWQSRSFEGKDQIKSEMTEIGTLVTVVLNITPDSGNTTFSLLVPEVAVSDMNGVAVATPAITTVHRSSLIGPPLGQDELYKTTPLTGTAMLVVF